jgi:hypothetical protein
LSCDDNNYGKENAQSDEAAGYPIMIYKILGKRGDIQCRSTVSAYYEPGDQSALVRAEPLQSSRSRRCVPYSHTYSAQDPESYDQPNITFHQAREYASGSEAQSPKGSADFRAEFILDAPARNHK